MATASGKPAINDPRGNTLRDLQQIVANVRQRFTTVEGAIATLQTTTVTTTQAATDLNALKKQVSSLEAELDALAEVVAGLDFGEFQTDPRTEQLAGEMMQAQKDLASMELREPERLPQLEATVATLQQQVETARSGATIEQRVACALTELELLQEGFAGTSGINISGFDCNGKLEQSGDRAQLFDVHFRTSASEPRRTASACLVRGARWSIRELREDGSCDPKPAASASGRVP